MAADAEVPVLIVGGGPVGLTTQVLLSRQGVMSLLVERHQGTSIHPRARGLKVRTMEILRGCGLESRVRAAGRDLEGVSEITWVETLAGREFRRTTAWGDPETVRTLSPTSGCACAQSDLEPILLAASGELGVGDAWFGYELISLQQDASGVTAIVEQSLSRERSRVRAQYVVGADGFQSRVRQALGVQVEGPGVLEDRIGVYFRSDLAGLVSGREAALYFIQDDPLAGVFVAVNNRDRWVYQIRRPADWPDGDGRAAATTAARLVRKAIGSSIADLEVLAILPWVMASQTAERFRMVACFLQVTRLTSYLRSVATE